jgi:hypothetical protein
VRRLGPAALLGLLLVLPLLGGAELHVWVDEHGVTHVSDDPKAAPKSGTVSDADAVELQSLWGGKVSGPPLVTPPGASGTDEDRVVRLLRDAVDDFRRGENARAASLLVQVLRREPDRPEAHYYLALLEGGRGHLDAAEAHLRAFLASAGDRFGPWRDSAEKRLAQLQDERQLMASPAAQKLRLVDLAHPDFRIQADAALVQTGGTDFATRVARYLDDAEELVGGRLGVRPAEPLGVVLYGKGAYLRAYAHRFSFPTVGFYDGRIHVISAAHPAGSLRTLLVHEYTHALFHEQTGGDTPFWLNEGLAELFERLSQGRPPLNHDERVQLDDAIADGDWLPLRRLAPSFSGLDEDQARRAYLIATAAADWIDRHSSSEARSRLLRGMGRGLTADQALRKTLGLDTDGVDAALRAEIRSEFPRPAALRGR